MFHKRKPKMDESGENRIQIRVQEWAKKLHPDALRNRLRNFRRYVISATTEKRDSTLNNCGEASTSTAASHLPYNCDSTMNSTRQYGKQASIDGEAKTQCEISKEKSDADDATISDIILQKNIPTSRDCANERNSNLSHKTSNSLQLAINIDSAPRNKSPITVQEWVDSLPLTPVESSESSREEDELPEKVLVPLHGDSENDTLTLGAEAGCLMDKKTVTTITPPVNVTITGCQEPSEVESHCSSLDSLLEARKPDPEEVLLSLGFGGTASSSYLETGRIPRRFLQQSQLKGVDIDDFIKQQQDLIYTFESGYYGYRGLAGAANSSTSSISIPATVQEFISSKSTANLDEVRKLLVLVRVITTLVDLISVKCACSTQSAGPSHSNPSVIVAKILEKLREHERETTSMTSYQLDFRKHCSLEKNPDNPVNNKFSKVARNVLTKIRCTPSSVLSPDNRRWLDSQGSKSPEIARRLIIGQKSFTFGRDGDLIEASNLDTANQIDLKDDCSKLELKTERVQPEEQHDTITDTVADRELSHCPNLGRRFTDSSTDMSVESIIVRNSELSCRNSDDRVSFPGRLDRRSRKEEITSGDDAIKTSTLKRLDHVDVDELSSLDSYTPSFVEEQNSHRVTYNNRPPRNRITSVASSIVEHESSANDCNISAQGCHRQYTSSSEGISLREELEHSGVPVTEVDSTVNRGSLKKLRNVLTRCSSFEESCKENSDDDVANATDSSFTEEYQFAEKAYQYADSATESEFASYSHLSLANKQIHRQYEELFLLQTLLHSLGRPIKIITKEQFSAISSEQRCAIQAEIIREALKAYLNQMTEDEIHSGLKKCLGAEVQKVADLLDASSDAAKLAVVVKQMTLLLQHQTQLSAQIKELSIVDEKPTSCHEMCDHILKRVHELELLVQQNAQELAHMKYQLSKKDNF